MALSNLQIDALFPVRRHYVGMTPDYAELFRIILNLIRLGTIAEVDCAAQKVRVNVGGNITSWRPWLTLRAGNAQTWWPPSRGEQVILLSPEGDFNQSIVLPAVYSAKYPSPTINPNHHTTRYNDGTVIQYDSAAHVLSAVLPKGGSAVIKADKVTSDAPDTFCTGNLTVQKNLIVNGLSLLNAGMTVLPGQNGASSRIEGQLNVSDDVIVNGISSRFHRHGGVQPGDADTGVAR